MMKHNLHFQIRRLMVTAAFIRLMCQQRQQTSNLQQKKFEEKVLVWIAIGPKGLSKALIRKSGFAINAKTYLDQCICRRLIPYIRNNYENGQYVFWPDQASAHYAKIVTDHLHSETVEFVEKVNNPANVPEICPIEDFWAILKAQVYKNG